MTRTVDQQGFKRERLILFLDFLSLAPTHAAALPHGLFLAGLIHVFMSREAVLSTCARTAWSRYRSVRRSVCPYHTYAGVPRYPEAPEQEHARRRPAFYRLPEDPAVAAQYLLLYEFSLSVGRDLNNRIDVGKSATRMTVVLNRLSSKRQIALDRRAQAWLEENAHDLMTEATGIAVAFAHVTRRNIESMLRGTITAMAVVSLLLIFVFKSTHPRTAAVLSRKQKLCLIVPSGDVNRTVSKFGWRTKQLGYQMIRTSKSEIFAKLRGINEIAVFFSRACVSA